MISNLFEENKKRQENCEKIKKNRDIDFYGINGGRGYFDYKAQGLA